jgi:hypothetical protein
MITSKLLALMDERPLKSNQRTEIGSANTSLVPSRCRRPTLGGAGRTGAAPTRGPAVESPASGGHPACGIAFCTLKAMHRWAVVSADLAGGGAWLPLWLRGEPVLRRAWRGALTEAAKVLGAPG